MTRPAWSAAVRRSGLPVLVVVACAAAAWPSSAGTWFEQQTIAHDGLTRYYRYFLPVVQPPGGYAVLFVLHGGGGDMESFLDNGTHAEWPAIADEDGVLLIVPNGVNRETGDPSGTDQAWNDCRSDVTIADTSADDVGFVSALIDWAAATYPVDLQRVYATGSSNGGMMSYRLAFELGDRIAAIAPFIANLPAVDGECARPDRAIPVFISNGDGETNYMPWDGGCVLANAGCQRGTVLSALATRDFWIAHNAISAVPVEHVDYPDLDPGDGATASSDRFAGGYEGTEVAFYRIAGGGHVTPSIAHRRSPLVLALLGLGNQCHDIEGSREAWAFLRRHTRVGFGSGSRPGEAGLLRVAHAGGMLTLTWAGDCGSGGSVGIYRGDLATGYASLAPEPGACTAGGGTATIPAGAGAAEFFLVVPNDGVTEGAYGEDSTGTPRPPAATPCHTQSTIDNCAAN